MRLDKGEKLALWFLITVGWIALLRGQWAVGLMAFLSVALMGSGISLSRKLSEVQAARRIINKGQLSWEVVSSIEAKDMKSSDIPNGLVVCAPNGMPALVDFDDDGEPQLDSGYREIAVANWIKTLMVDERFAADALVLVHTVEGKDTMLIKSLQVSKLTMNGEPITVQRVALMGVLPKYVKTIRDNYMKKMETQCGSTADNTAG